MRALVISLVLFLVLLLLMIGSMVLINRVCDKMTDDLDALSVPPTMEDAETVKNLRDYWLKWRRWVHPAVNHTELNTVSDLLDSLVFYADPTADETVEYRRSCQLLRNAIDELRRLERLSWDNLV